ncbi:MAG TPA: hypothetical protein VFH59_08320 [Frateuria sp.]|uniref:hypothetical protein n=1 Tax=Frateuria sp. TaxID=2211372 RepID=UPI002D7FA552|nr:hypothetical protein [Frateuria sp.]HET6805427.1 hypothetical protein [Frateuria sp.]
MSDTIDLLEAIGRDASLRHAPAHELQQRLQEAGASGALKAAASSGDASRLAVEFGPKAMYSPQTSQTFHEDEGLGEEEGPPPLPSPDPDSDHAPPQP